LRTLFADVEPLSPEWEEGLEAFAIAHGVEVIFGEHGG
jgi:hypothetical protein